MRVSLFKAVFTLLTVLLITTSVTAADGFRTWKSHNQNHSVEARFDEYATDSSVVTLVDRDGNSIEVALEKLSAADQKYVLRRHKKLVAAEKVDNNPFKTIGKSSKEQSRSSQPDARTLSLWGIEWTPRLKNAQAVAAGQNPGSKDDRPIMWFRVLGDLTGNM